MKWPVFVSRWMRWYRKNVHRLRAVAVFVLFQIMTGASPETLMEWEPKRWIYGILVASVFAMKAGEWNNQKDNPKSIVPPRET
jgi:hypothetical protein